MWGGGGGGGGEGGGRVQAYGKLAIQIVSYWSGHELCWRWLNPIYSITAGNGLAETGHLTGVSLTGSEKCNICDDDCLVADKARYS